MNSLDRQGLQSSPLTNPAAASSSGAASSCSTDEKITQVVSANESGPHAAAGASSQSLEGRKLQQEDLPPVVLDLSGWGLSNADRMAQIQNSGGTITLLKLGNLHLSKELLEQIAKFCPQLKELELSYLKWGLDQLIEAQSAFSKGVLLTNTDYSTPNRKELEKYLDYCAPFGGPTCLNLEKISDLMQSELDELIEAAPNLRSLTVRSDQLTNLSAPNAIEINCQGCTGLQNLSAPNAPEINCQGCTGLQNLSAPHAISICCWDCTGLQNLSAPNATIIGCWGCPRLQSLSAPNATIIGCEECTSLQSISAPNATRINCNDCTGLQTLSAPKATEIDCRGCTSLQSLGAPNATRINCRGCTRLHSISAPNATGIDCSGCTGLQSIDAPKATDISCWCCTKLQSISAPKATEVYCWNCPGLQSISAPKATRINCNDCTGLQTLSAPKATDIDCEGCTNLQNLNVPLSAISGWKEDPLLSLERLQMGAKMPSPEEMQSLEASHPELAQKIRKLTVLTLQDLARNCIHGNPQIETEGFPAPLLQYEDIETTYLATPKK